MAEEMDEETYRDMLRVISLCPMTEDQVTEVMNARRFVDFKKEVDADAESTTEEKLLAKELLSVALPGCVIMLGGMGLNSITIAKILRANQSTVHHHLKKWQWNIKTRPQRGSLWQIDKNGKLCREVVSKFAALPTQAVSAPPVPRKEALEVRKSNGPIRWDFSRENINVRN